jgi:hypothetical protein
VQGTARGEVGAIATIMFYSGAYIYCVKKIVFVRFLSVRTNDSLLKIADM